jgi:hypothetical protein
LETVNIGCFVSSEEENTNLGERWKLVRAEVDDMASHPMAGNWVTTTVSGHVWFTKST